MKILSNYFKFKFEVCGIASQATQIDLHIDGYTLVLLVMKVNLVEMHRQVEGGGTVFDEYFIDGHCVLHGHVSHII